MLAGPLTANLALKSSWTFFNKKRSLLATKNPKPTKTGVLFFVLLIYLIGSRLGPVVFRFSSSINDSLIESCENCLSEDYRLLIKETLHLLKTVTKAPGLLITRR